MDKTLFSTNGGVRFGTDLWDFSQQGVRDALKGLMDSFAIDETDAFILHGCERSGSFDLDVAAGWVYLAGEICQVDGVTMSALSIGNHRTWDFQISYASDDPIVFGDGSSHNTRQIRKAVPSQSAVLPVYTFGDDFNLRMKQWLSYGEQDTFHVVGNMGEPAFSSLWSAQEDVKFIKEQTLIAGYYRVHLIGSCTKSASTTANEVIFTLPAGYRPAIDTIFTFPHTSAFSISIKIKTNGEIQFTASSVSGPLMQFTGRVSFWVAN